MVRQVDDRAIVRERRLMMGYAEYLAWTEGDGHHGEWVDGEVIVFEMPKPPHQQLLLFLGALLGGYAELRRLGVVLVAPCEMRIRGRLSSREPDVLFVATENAARVTADRVEGAADLVVEFVSNDSVTRDRRDKFREYEAEGIPEYWVIDSRPGRRRAEFFQLGDDRRYRAVEPGSDGRYRSAVLAGFWLDPGWLWRTPLPNPAILLAIIAADEFRSAVVAELSEQDADGG